MNILKVVTLVTAVVLALAAQGSAAGGTTSVYTVLATAEAGLNTGLVLEHGSVTVTATGTICYIGDQVCVGPDGLSAVSSGLVGRVGSGPWVRIGSGPKKLSGSGELVLAVGDSYYPDNTGSFEVTVSYKESGVSRTCWPGWGWGDINHVHCGPPGQNKKTSESSQPTQGSSDEHGKSEGNGTRRSDLSAYPKRSPDRRRGFCPLKARRSDRDGLLDGDAERRPRLPPRTESGAMF